MSELHCNLHWSAKCLGLPAAASRRTCLQQREVPARGQPHLSSSTRRLAPVRLSPAPPAVVDSRKTWQGGKDAHSTCKARLLSA